MGFLYLLLAVTIYAILVPIGLLYGLVINIRGTNQKLTRFAQTIDRTGNVLCAEVFNSLLLTKDSVDLFGDGRESISSVIGRNVLVGTLSAFGVKINKMLDKVAGEGHSVRNIGY